MKKLYLRGIVLMAMISLLSSFSLGVAQEPGLAPDMPPGFDPEAPMTTTYSSDLSLSGLESGQLVNCFDTYRFGSVEMSITEDNNNYEPGDPIVLTGTIKNTNPYPLIGVSVMARLVKDIPNANDQAKTMTIEEFKLADNVNLEANGSLDVNHIYTLSTAAAKGSYEFMFFAYQKDRFSLSGLTFTDDVYGSKVNFEVGGNNKDQIYLDQTRTTVGSQKHINHAFPTMHNLQDTIEVKIPLKNTTAKEQKMKLEYRLYHWDGLREDSLERFNTEEVVVPANGEVVLTQKVENPSLPVYYLKISAVPVEQASQAAWQQSVSNIRFVVRDINQGKLNFVGLNTFPKAAEQESKVVTCIHNTNEGTIDNLQVETVVSDTLGRQVAKSVYRGPVSGAISAIATDIPKDRILNRALVTSVIKDADGNVIDSVNILYDCNQLNPASCIAESGLKNVLNILLSIGGLVLVVLAVGYAGFMQKEIIVKLFKKKS